MTLPTAAMRMRITLRPPKWSRGAGLACLFIGLQCLRSHALDPMIGWIIAAVGTVLFAPSVGQSVLVVDPKSNSVSLFSKGRLMLISDFDFDLSDCTAARLCTRGPFEWVELVHRGAPHTLWRSFRGGADREDVRALHLLISAAHGHYRPRVLEVEPETPTAGGVA